MHGVTKVDRNYPSNVICRLSAGDDFRVVDLRDEEDMRRIRRMMSEEFSPLEPTGTHEYFHYPDELDMSEETAVDDDLDLLSFKTDLLIGLVSRYHDFSRDRSARMYGISSLPSPFRNGHLDMEVPWVKELAGRLRFRLVHVFVREDGNSKKVHW